MFNSFNSGLGDTYVCMYLLTCCALQKKPDCSIFWILCYIKMGSLHCDIVRLEHLFLCDFEPSWALKAENFANTVQALRELKGCYTEV